jgi:hypothetical protein
MVHLYIATPCYNTLMTCQYTISLLNMLCTLSKHGITYVIDFLGNESLIPRARNRSLEKFLKTDCTHLFFIDSDISFPPDAILKMLDFDKDVTGCAYPKKNIIPERLLTSLQLETESKEKLDSRLLDFVFNRRGGVDMKEEGEFVKVDHTGTGFMLIQRGIIEKLCKKHTELIITNGELPGEQYALFSCMIKNRIYLSEDYSFCQRVNDIGGEVWLNIKTNLNHIGTYCFASDIKNRAGVL